MAGSRSDLPACCQQTADELFAEYQQQADIRENEPLSRHLADVASAYPFIWRRAQFVSQVRVANIQPPASAMRISAICKKCGIEASTIVISSTALLCVWRLLLLFGVTVEAWEYQDNSLVIRKRLPNSAEVTEFKRTIAEYVSGAPMENVSIDEYTTQLARVIPNLRPILLRCIDLGQLWILAHEVGHALGSGYLQYAEPVYMAHRLEIERYLENIDIGPRTQRMWAEELEADIIATDLLFKAVGEKSGVPSTNALMREQVAAEVCGGLAAACEVIYQLELGVLGSRPDRKTLTPGHPPAHLRWTLTTSYLRYLAQAREEVDLYYLGEFLAGLSKGFEKAALAQES